MRIAVLLAATTLLLPGNLFGQGAIGKHLPWEGPKHADWSQTTLKRFPTPRKMPPKHRYYSVPTKKKVVAFTFDDGPRPWTNQVLDALKERNLRGTFYVIGKDALRYPKILKRMVAEGHEIGNHTMTHAWLFRNPPNEVPHRVVEQEIRLAHEAILQTTGVAPKTIRPPGGLLTEEQSRWVYEAFGYVDVHWSVNPGDATPGRAKPSTAVFRRRVLSQVGPGKIILSHDLWKSTVAAIPSTLDALLAEGYEFVTVSELLAIDDPYEAVQWTAEETKALQ